jgi:hypothetical protein
MARPAASGVGARQDVLSALDEPPEAVHALRAGRERGQHQLTSFFRLTRWTWS